MNLAAVSDAIEARITGDTGAGGLYESGGAVTVNGVWFDTTIGGAEPPYIVVSFPDAAEDDTFPTDAVSISVLFDVVTLNRAGRWSEDSAILGRLKARFHRWGMTLSGASATLMGRVTGTTQHEPDYRHYLETYEVRVEEA